MKLAEGRQPPSASPAGRDLYPAPADPACSQRQVRALSTVVQPPRSGGGRATRDLRIGERSCRSRSGLSHGDENRAAGDRVFPKGYDVAVEAGSIPSPTMVAPGPTVFRSPAPARGRSTSSPTSSPISRGRNRDHADATVFGERRSTSTVRAWPDDSAWNERVTPRARRVLPALGERIGLAVADYGAARRRGDQPLDRWLRRPLRPAAGEVEHRLLRRRLRGPA